MFYLYINVTKNATPVQKKLLSTLQGRIQPFLKEVSNHMSPFKSLNYQKCGSYPWPHCFYPLLTLRVNKNHLIAINENATVGSIFYDNL